MSPEINDSHLFVHLERAESVLQELRNRITGLNATLEFLEVSLQPARKSIAKFQFKGKMNGILLLPTAECRRDPLRTGYTALRDSNISLIVMSDCIQTGAIESMTNLVRLVNGELSGSDSQRFVIVLRWAPMIRPLERRKAIVIGKRYYRDPQGVINELKKELVKLGFEVFEDRGEYGGGFLVYMMTNSIFRQDILIIELTLARQTCTDISQILRLGSMLSKFQVPTDD
ncbi:MAG: hypothetical protein ACFE7R_10050 [Candidatus Hodarchaeota archaeon]